MRTIVFLLLLSNFLHAQEKLAPEVWIRAGSEGQVLTTKDGVASFADIDIATETDPTIGAHIKNITQADINNWNNAEVLSNSELISIVQGAGFLESETDPTIPNYIKSITQANIAAWNDDKNTQLSSAQVVTIADNAGFLRAEADGSVNNELQYLGIQAATSGAKLQLSSNGGEINLFGDGVEIVADGNTLTFSVDATGSGGGGIATETDPTIPNYIKSITQANIAAWNDDKNTQLSSAQVVTIADNAGFLRAEADGSVDNETQYLGIQAAQNGAKLQLSNNGGEINLFGDGVEIVADGNTLTFSVDATGSGGGGGNNIYVQNNAPTSAKAGDLWKEIGTQNQKIWYNDGSGWATFSTQIGEGDVDLWTANNGYLQDSHPAGLITLDDIGRWDGYKDTKRTDAEIKSVIATEGYLTENNLRINVDNNGKLKSTGYGAKIELQNDKLKIGTTSNTSSGANARFFNFLEVNSAGVYWADQSLLDLQKPSWSGVVANQNLDLTLYNLQKETNVVIVSDVSIQATKDNLITLPEPSANLVHCRIEIYDNSQSAQYKTTYRIGSTGTVRQVLAYRKLEARCIPTASGQYIWHTQQ